jgi:UDP-glucose 4-epimerase
VDLEQMRIAITGGSGFIGSHVVDRLADDGHTVVVLDTRPPHRSDVLYRQLDITDPAETVLATRGCDVVFHLAAVSNVNEVFDRPVEAMRINVLGTANVWEAARRNGVKRAVLASTVWVYAGASGTDPVDEEAPFHLSSAGHIYTSSKISSELIAHNYLELYGLPFTILRYGIPFGPRMREALVIPQVVRKALDGETITIHGDGSQFRNYVYIKDLADAHAICLKDIGENGVFNLEGAEPVSIRRLTESVQRALGRPIAVEFLPDRPGDFRGREVSAIKAAQVLGWRATTSFDEGLKRYVDWYRTTHQRAEERDPPAG